MYVYKTAYDNAYASIVSNARKALSLASASAASTVLILTALDVDALCAARVLVSLLNDDSVGYKVVPISGWAELSRVNETHITGNNDLRSVVLLNLGALIDLVELLSPLPPRVALHVIDSHRPWNLKNVFASGLEADKIVVWDDGDIEETMKEEKAAYAVLEELQRGPESESDDSDFDSDEESDSEDDDIEGTPSGPNKKRRRRRVADSDESEIDSNDGSPVSRRGKKRKKRRRVDEDGNEVEDEENPNRVSRKERQRHEARLSKYYNAGTFYGQSVALQLYLLATSLERTNNDMLWHAIMGLTYQFTTNLIDRERYDAFVVSLSDEVARLNINHELVVQTGANLAVSGPADRSIRPSEELRFMLFRHWNLYDAMFHSGYVAGKLKLWRDRGRKNLQGLLAKMGFSLLQCRQTYVHMDIDLKQNLRNKVDSIAPEYGLFELAYPSFIRTAGYQSVLSASDAVEAVGALLEVGTAVRLDFGKDGGFKSWNAFIRGEEDNKENLAPANADKNSRNNGQNNNQNRAGNFSDILGHRPDQAQNNDDLAKDAKKQDLWWVKNFWLAWHALGQDCTHMRRALTLSMALHRSVIRQGTSMLDKQAIKTLRTFRLAIIKEGPDAAVFVHPATLTRLAVWLVDAIRDLIDRDKTGSRKKSLPFVIACLDERADAYLVVGINGAAEYGDVRKNKFGLAFQEASQISGARTRHDNFEAGVLEIRKDDLQGFLDRLHLALH